MSWISRWAIALALAFLCGLAPAQNAASPTTPEVTLSELRTQLDDIPQTIEPSDDVRQLVAQTDNIAAQVGKFVASRTGQLADLNARLGELGNAPPTGTTEDPNVTRQRAALLKERNVLDADIRLARLLAVDAQQRGSDLLAQRRALFEAQLFGQVDPPLGSAFWRQMRAAWPSDRALWHRLAGEWRTGLATSARGPLRTAVLATVFGALLLTFVGGWAAENALVWLVARFTSPGRLRRSLLALASVAADVLLAGLAAQLLWQTLAGAGDWSAQAQQLATSCVKFFMFMAFVVGLGRALLAGHRPAWRLPPLSDAMAARMAPFPWLVALVAALTWLPAKVNTLVDASLAAVVTTHAFTALALSVLAGGLLLRLRLPREAAAAVVPSEGAPPEVSEPTPASSAAGNAAEAVTVVNTLGRPPWVGYLMGMVMLLLVAIWVLLALGYVALASFLASQLIWAGVVGATGYLLLKFVDDLSMALLSSGSLSGQRLQASFDVAPQALDQAAVLLSGASRVVVFFYMVIALVAPLGTSPDQLLQRSGKIGASFKIGQFQLVPSAILGAAAVLVGGFVALRLIKHWLNKSYLPNTKLEPGIRNSVVTLIGYLGGILVISFSLSALGIGVERIAWVASALSVGIGFGLQAIVQNFISGLILLAERPVKVGDWVVLGNAEGDVRRINVRATEIQLGDRSTLIVPNSELITKTVRNMTLGSPDGRVLIRLPMPLTTDTERVRRLMLAACNEHPGVLPAPAPSLTLEGIEGGSLIFQAIAYVAGPRQAGGVRSDLLFTILERLREAGQPLAVPTLMLAPARHDGALAPGSGAMAEPAA
ncbi:MAG: hypothetical protein JWQ03_2401 [Variovorax sp.]|nr:hypothetical protein [Variovorax sp.]